MLKLTQGRHQAEAVGEPLYMPFNSSLNGGEEDAKLTFRKGQLGLLVAPPGLGKSMVVQYGLQHGNRKGGLNRGIYFSADSDPYTMFTRAASFASGYSVQQVDRDMKNPDLAGAVDESVSRATEHMWFDFRSEITPDHLVSVIAAYATRQGVYPEFIVIDNLKNFIIEEMLNDEFAMSEQALVILNDIAHITGAAVIALHHVTGEYEAAAEAIPMSGIRGKVSKTPSVIYSAFKNQDNDIIFSVLKDRAGRADSKGGFMGVITVDYDKGTFW